MSDGRIIIDTLLDSNGIEKDLNKLGGVAGAALKGVSIAVAGVSTALLGIGAYAISVGTKFEAGMSKVKAISGATATDMEKLAEKAKEMGATTKFSATESADALQFMALAGWKTSDMLKGLPGIMNLAAASGEDLASVSDIVTDSLSAFGMKANESGHFADVLAKASSNSNTNVAMLGESFKYVAPLAGALGYSVEDASVALGLMANSGIKASQSGTSLKTALVNMAKPTSKMKKVMDEYGLSLTNADGTMKPLSAVTDELRTKMGGLDKSTQAAAAATLFGKESLAGMLAVINASPAEYEKLTGAINNADGAAKQMADTMNDNLQGQMTLMKSALEGLGLQIYEKMEEPLKEAAKTAIESISRISKSLTDGALSSSVDKLAEGFGNLITKIAESVEIWLPRIINAFTWIMDNSNTIATGIIGIGTALAVLNVANMVNKLVTAFKDARAAEEGLTVVQWLLNAAMDANPIGIIVAIIVGVIAAIIYLWKTNEGFRNFWIGVWQAISDFFVGIWDGIIGFFTTTIPEAFNSFIVIVSALPGQIGAFFTNIYNDFMAWGASVIAWVATTIPQVIDNILTFFNELPGKLGYALGIAIGTVIKFGIDLVKWVIDTIPKVVNNIITFFNELPGKTATAFTNVLNKIIQWGASVISWIATAIPQMVGNIINFYASLPGKVATLFGNVLTKIIEWGTNVISWASNTIPGIVDDIVTFFSDLPGKMIDIGVNVVKGLWNGIKSMIGWLGSKVSDFAGGIVSGMKDALGIHSPSRVMRDQIGKYMAQGVGVGFEDESDNLQNDMQNSISDLTAKMRATVDYETANTTAKVVASSNYKDNSQSVTNNNDNGVTQNVTIVNPERTPSENARALKKVGRDLAFG